MRNEGLGAWPARRARMTPHRVAIVYEGRTMTYGELSVRVMRLANSPYYGLSRRIGSASRAVVLLGFSAVRALAM